MKHAVYVIIAVDDTLLEDHFAFGVERIVACGEISVGHCGFEVDRTVFINLTLLSYIVIASVDLDHAGTLLKHAVYVIIAIDDTLLEDHFAFGIERIVACREISVGHCGFEEDRAVFINLPLLSDIVIASVDLDHTGALLNHAVYVIIAVDDTLLEDHFAFGIE